MSNIKPRNKLSSYRQTLQEISDKVSKMPNDVKRHDIKDLRAAGYISFKEARVLSVASYRRPAVSEAELENVITEKALPDWFEKDNLENKDREVEVPRVLGYL